MGDLLTMKMDISLKKEFDLVKMGGTCGSAWI